MTIYSLFDTGLMFFREYPKFYWWIFEGWLGNLIINSLGNIVLAIIGGLVSILSTIKYMTNQQRAIQINENLNRCLFEIIKNKN